MNNSKGVVCFLMGVFSCKVFRTCEFLYPGLGPRRCHEPISSIPEIIRKNMTCLRTDSVLHPIWNYRGSIESELEKRPIFLRKKSAPNRWSNKYDKFQLFGHFHGPNIEVFGIWLFENCFVSNFTLWVFQIPGYPFSTLCKFFCFDMLTFLYSYENKDMWT